MPPTAETDEQQGPWTDYAPQAAGAERGPWEDYAQTEEKPKPPVTPVESWWHRTFAPREVPHASDLAVGPNAKNHPMPGSFEGHPENVGEYAPATIGEAAGGLKDLGVGYVTNEPHKMAHGVHRMAGAATSTIAPALPMIAAAAPIATGVTLASGAAGQKAGEKTAEYLGADPEYQELAGDVGALALGAGGAKFSERFAPSAVEARRIGSGQERFNEALDTPPGKKGEKAAQMKEDVRVATKDLAAIEKDTPSKVTWLLRRGKGADSFHELAEKIDARQDEMWEKGHQPGIDRHAEAPINHDAIRNAGERVLANREAVENAPEEAASARKWLDSIASKRGLKSADNLIREINADMKSKASANQPYSELQTRVRKEVVKELRNEVERVLDESGEEGVKEVNRRWGALENIKGRLQERGVQLARAEAKEGPLPEWAKVYGFLHPDSIGAAVGVGVNAAKVLKPNASSRLTGAMRDFGRTSLEAPYEAAPPPGWGASPKGLLPAPKPQLPLNATPDASSVLAVEPATTVQRGAGGRMGRQATGMPKPQPVGWTAEGGPIYEPVPTPKRAERPIEQRQEMNQLRVPPTGEERRGTPPAEGGASATRDALVKAINDVLNDPLESSKNKAAAKKHLEDIQKGSKARGQKGARESGVRGGDEEERRGVADIGYSGPERRRGWYEIHKENVGPDEGEKLERDMRTVRSGPTRTVEDEGKAIRHIMEDSEKYAKFRVADKKTQGEMIKKAQLELESKKKTGE